MTDETAGRNPEAPEEAPVPTDDELVLATEEQRNQMLEGGEIQWTEEQLEVLGKDAPKQEPEQLGTEVVLGALDRAIEHEAVIQSKAEKSAAYQKLRKRAQAAEEREKEKERKLIELEAQNKAYKESLERLGPEEDYDLNDPEDLERYLAKKREDLGSTEDQPEPEYQTIPDEIARYEEERPRFADADGNVYDGKVDNPTGKPYFRIKNKEGKERVIFDRFALDEYDQNMYERFGPEVYKSMWGTPQRPGVMAVYRDKAPTEEIMQILSAPDPGLRRPVGDPRLRYNSNRSQGKYHNNSRPYRSVKISVHHHVGLVHRLSLIQM